MFDDQFVNVIFSVNLSSIHRKIRDPPLLRVKPTAVLMAKLQHLVFEVLKLILNDDEFLMLFAQ